jgi:hypothetical protein
MTTEQTLKAWAAAELAGDPRSLLTDDFRAVGPVGFVLDADGWAGRFSFGDGLRYTAFDLSEAETREVAGTTITVARLDQRGAIGERSVDGTFRATVVVVGDKLAGVHLSPVPQP